MRATLMWTVNDFPAYSMLSRWSTQGKLACPVCMDGNKAFTLKNGGKNSWFDSHHRFLPHNQAFRKSKNGFTKDKVVKDDPPPILTGEEIFCWVHNFPRVVNGPVSKLPGYGDRHNWIKRSIFWDLPYWKDNLLRHNLDVMHIEKKLFDNVFNTVMKVKKKTKDNDKARRDLAIICQHSDLELIEHDNGKTTKPKANYCFSSNEAKKVCEWIKELKMLGMKNHDCHVFMECLLPFAFSSLPDFVWKPLTELSQFFKGLCSNTLREDELIKLGENIPFIICKLERIFPPVFFNSMEHLPVHLPYEAKLGGPIQYRWMYPFERMMGDYKHTVKNKARVENISQRNEAARLNDVVTTTLSISNQLGRPSGKPQTHWLSDVEKRYAHVHILINCNEVKPYIDAFLHYNSINEEDPASQARIHGESPEWFRAYATNEANGVTDPNLISLAWGPESKGFTRGGEDDFYGVIQHIFELQYHKFPHKIALFYCRWFDPRQNRGTKVHPHYDIVDIKMNRKYDLYDPFIIAQKARQVYYVPYPEMRRDKCGWCAVIQTKPRGRVEVDDVDENIPYQNEDMTHVEQLNEIEEMDGLHDETNTDEEADLMST
ncbi:uncharacterized protein LOC123886649 [Trifolium pratense]|uniref:uncharacterized protein LOC123886649 n=1 Tax=Trifolium pratense TaxID=57577 RepID=UPI001E6920BE|nr:uncharacterized protein LOC123886649 [Trifolium pratense]